RQAATPPPSGMIAAAQDKSAFIPLRRVSANGAPVAVRSRLYRLHNVPLPAALDAIIPSTMDAEIDHDAELSGIRVSVTGRRQWTDALEKAMAQSGLYARVDWDSRKIYISRSYFAVIAADRMRTTNRRAALRAGSGDHASEAAHVLPGHRKSRSAEDGYHKIADADFNRAVARAGKESGGAAKSAAIAVAPSSPSVVKMPAAPAVASLPLKTGAAVLPPEKKKSSIKPVGAAFLSGKSKRIGKEKTKPDAIRLIRGEMLSEAIRRYAATAGYAVLWNVNYHLRIERNVTIPPPPTFKQGLSIMLRPAGGLKADSYGHKLIVITDKDR
ncbi:MAG TPA: hypothetical protein DEP05_08230, partial [Betaproteobacteria bacterium]|nr:hypothetical protein [Betaproteobacteria bacterium]